MSQCFGLHAQQNILLKQALERFKLAAKSDSQTFGLPESIHRQGCARPSSTDGAQSQHTLEAQLCPGLAERVLPHRLATAPSQQQFIDVRRFQNFCIRHPASSAVKLSIAIHCQDITSISGGLQLLQPPAASEYRGDRTHSLKSLR